MPAIDRGFACLLVQKDYSPGDMPPEGYLAWHEWAGVQHKAGLKQESCGHCARFKYPQELSDKTHSFEAMKRGGEKVTITYRICRECAKR